VNRYLPRNGELVRLFIVRVASCFEVEELLSRIGKDLEYVPELSVETVFKWIRAERLLTPLF
jgi:hypothetical protein